MSALFESVDEALERAFENDDADLVRKILDGAIESVREASDKELIAELREASSNSAILRSVVGNEALARILHNVSLG